MSGRLKGHSAVVTGAAGGIGGAIAQRFALEGCRIAALDLVLPDCGEINLTCDMASDLSVDGAAKAIASGGMQPTIVVHAAAMGARAKTLDTDSGFLLAVMDVNVGGAFRLAHAFAPAMRMQENSAFLFISSINSSFATPNLAAYAASKAALDSFTKTLALELAEDRIRVNAIRPASIDTPLLRGGFLSQPDPNAARRDNIARHPLGRLGTPEDVASLALFLCSDEASWITGVDYLIDGGASITRR
ncbi:SDR family NAD(P)-dependent oxidoreductase [Sphingomonas sp. M1-B02]|uniref:SDR family NAD(P)-dependent oxidoreductase n=1 Tax=Sphingomonas sp. M1-B02 TaxID=3114300 RepID=UPI00223F43B4|nr:SDR family oxidoreductase [Sphingomonas sp. S6-11]UZK65444.1 SDR family oxidoreductase [Sphingomonas sp. S6-11]